MKRNSIWKKGISLLLVISMVLGVTGTMAWVQAATEVPSALTGYTKVSPEDFGITEEVVHTQSGTNIDESYYANNITTFNHTYFDADVSFTAADINSGLNYLNPYLFRFYIVGDTLAVYSLAASVLVYQTELEDLGIEAGGYFNLKFATDITDNASNSENSDVTVQMWVNNDLVTPVNDTVTVADAYIGNVLNVTMTQGGTFKIRPHVEEQDGDPLVGYQKLGAEAFGITEEKEYATLDSMSTEYITEVDGTNKLYFDNKYIEADIAFTGDQGLNNSIQPIGTGMFMIYVSWGNFYVYCEKTAQVLYQTPITELGGTGTDGEYIHLKFAADVVDNATDATKTDVTVKIWVNDILVTPSVGESDSVTITVDDMAITNTLSVGLYGSAGTVKIKPHVEESPEEPTEDPLVGYQKLGAEAFGITEEKEYATLSSMSTEYITDVYETNKVYFDKKYIEADIAFTGDQGLNNSIQPIGTGMFMIYVSWGNFYVYCEKTAQVLYQTPITELGGTGTDGEYIHLKFATDVVDNTSDTTKTDITVKIWVNDVLVTPSVGEADSVTITVDDTAITNTLSVGLYGSAGSIKIKPHVTQEPENPDNPENPENPETPDVTEALQGYTKVTVRDFGITEETVHTYAGTNLEQNYYYENNISSFDKTYLDADISLTVTDVYSGFGYLNPYLLRVYMVDETLAVYSLAGNALVTQTDLSALGIEPEEYFNLKLATDITDNASNSDNTDVKVQIWVNDQAVTLANDTVTVADAYIGSWINVTLWQDGTIKIKPQEAEGPENPENPEQPESTDPAVALKGYTRVTPNSFAIIEEVFTHGWTEGNWMGYEYPESLDHSYLDVDIALCQDDTFNNAIRYLSSNGWESLLIGIVGDKFQIYETRTATLVYQVSLSEAGIAADKYFNMKLSTDIDGTTVTLGLWINDKLVRSVTGKEFAKVTGCTAIGNMLGVYLPYEGTIRIKTPKVEGGDQEKPNVTEQPNPDFKELTFKTFAINDGKYEFIGPKLGADGTYIFNVNETVFSGDFHFSKEAGADFRYGGKGNPWLGLRFWTTGDGKLYMQDAESKTEIFAFHPMYAGVQLVDNTFNMKLSVEFVDSDGDGAKDDVKLGVWFNDVLYRSDYIYLTDYAANMGNACSVYVMNEGSWISISSDKAVYTGVDFTLFGFTTNWKKELGIK